MALPQTIGTSLEVSNTGYAGPFRASNGDHYVVLQVTSNKDVVAVYKADNGDNTWTEQDSAGRPISGTVTDRQGLCATLSGTVIHVATWGSSGSNRYVHYHAFDTSSDTWTTTEEAVAGPFSANTGDGSCSIEVRSDGDKVIFYQGPYELVHSSNYDRIYYAVHQGTAWTDASGFLQTGSAKQYRNVYTVKGASDKIHVFYSNENNLEVEHVSFDSSNTVSSVEVVTTASSANPLSRPFYFDNGGAETITVGIMEGTTAYRYTVVNDGTPGGGEAVSDAAVHQDFAGAHRSFGMAANPATGIEYLAYVDSSTQDLWYDVRDGGTWGTDTEVLDAITGKRLCVNIFTIDNGDTVLAYVYNDNATIKYHETVIEVAASGVSLAGAGTIDFTATGALGVDTPLASTGSIGITATANLSIDTPLSASASIGIDSTAALGVDTPLSASAILTFTGTAGLGIDTPLNASGAIALTGTGALGIDTPLSASASIGLDSSAALSVDTPLSASGAIAFTSAGALSIDTPLSASGSIGIDSTGALSIDTPLTANATIGIDATANLSTGGAVSLAAVASISLSGTSSLSIDTPLSAAGSIAFTGTSALSIDTPLSASGVLSIDGAGALGIDTPLAASSSIDFVSTANLSIDSAVSLAASAVLSFTGAGALSIDTPLSASATMGITATSALSIDTPLNASAVLSFTGIAALTVAGTLSVDDDRLIILTPRRRSLRPDALLREMELTPRRRVIRVED